MAIYDVFISYRHKDAEVVNAFADGLRSEGLEVWIDERRIDDLTSIQAGIEDGLTHSKIFLAWYSVAYPESRPCQWEFTAAFITALAAGQAMERIVVINPEGTPDHIHPELYRDQKYLIPSGRDYVGLAQTIKARLELLTGTFGEFIRDGKLMTKPPWYGRYPTSADYFMGRLCELWKIHSTLHAYQYPVVRARTPVLLVQIIGLGGIGKSLLIEEYGMRFGSQYPGGIYWLNARGNVDDQIETFAINLGLPIRDLKPAEVRPVFVSKLRKSEYPFLWIVDDLPESIGEEAFQRWLLPDIPLARTVITTRFREFEGRGSQLVLDELSPDQAFDLLTRRVKPEESDEKLEAKSICLDLGYHPLALDVASRAIAGSINRPRFTKYRERLNNPSKDELEFAASLKGRLPNGHEKSISATLGESFKSLSKEGKNLLRLSAVLASAPIPYKLALDSMANYHEIPTDEAETLVRLGLDELVNIAFSRIDSAGKTFQVHALVARTVRYYEYLSVFQKQLREIAVAELTSILSNSNDICEHAALLPFIIHAKHLVEMPSNEQAEILAEWVAHFEYKRGVYYRARQLQERVLEVRCQTLGEEHPDTLNTMNNLAETLGAQGDFAGARQLHERVLEVRCQTLGEEHPDTLNTMNNLAETLGAQGDFAGARQLQERVLEVRCQTLGEEHPDTLNSMNNLVLLLNDLGDLTDARRLGEQVMEVYRRTLGEEHPDTLTSMNNLALALHAQGDFAGARQLHERALELRHRILGEEHPDTMCLMNNLAELLHAQGDFLGARRLGERVLSVCQRILGKEHPDTLTSMNNLAEKLRFQGDFSGARQLQEWVLEVCRRTLGEEHPDTLGSLNNLAITLNELGDSAGACQLHERVLAVCRRTLGEEHDLTMTSMTNLATALDDQGDFTRACRLGERVFEVRCRRLGEEHPDTTGTAWNLYNMLLKLDRGETAFDIYQRSLGWLLQAEPESLSYEQAKIRERLINMFKESG